MQRQDFLELARTGRGWPIGVDLLLHEPGTNHDRHNGRQLAEVVHRAARRFGSPLGIPLMDLTLEKKTVLDLLGPSAPEVVDGMLHQPLAADRLDDLLANFDAAQAPALQAPLECVRQVAQAGTVLPVGMHIGPFSLVSKLLADPITSVYLSGSGLTAEDEELVAVLESAIELATGFLERYADALIRAGAKTIFIAEPAANQVYFSPNQLAQGAEIFERFVMRPNRRLRQRLQEQGVELIFHCCGELIDEMVRQFGSLRPVILSLGSSRQLWHDAGLVPNDVILYGNLPSKQFYSDELTPLDRVRSMARALQEKMAHTRHPFILGSECDVLNVEGATDTIAAKADLIAELSDVSVTSA